MQTKTKMMVCVLILFLFNFMTIIGTDITADITDITEPSTIHHLTRTTIVNGAIEPLEKVYQKPVVITEVGNIPLRRQLGKSCGTTSFAMVMDWLDQPYRTQEFYDQCAYRQKDKGTKLIQLQYCAYKLGIKTTIDYDYDINKLKTGDIVVYKRFKSSNTTHASVVDSVEDNIIRIANPWNVYDEYTMDEFKHIYINETLTIGE